MLARLMLAVGVAALHLGPLPAQRNAADSAIVVTLAMPKSQAVERVVQAFTAEGIAVTGSEGGVVTGAGREKSVDVEHVATVVARNSANSLVTLSAFAKYTPYLANTVNPIEARVTSKLKGGGKVWTRVQRVGDAIQNGS